MASCGMSCVKGLLFSFNLVFALCSLALLLLGVLCQVSVTSYYAASAESNPESSMLLPLLLWIIIAISGFAFLLSFMGCLGAIRESRCLMFSFGFLLALVLLIEVVTIGVAYSQKDSVQGTFEVALNSTLPKYLKDVDIAKSWDVTQTDLKCCGVQGPRDWEEVFKNETLPVSCCPEMPVGTQCNFGDEAVSPQGCLGKILEGLQSKAMGIYIVAIIIGIVEIFGVILACCLGCSITDQYRTV